MKTSVKQNRWLRFVWFEGDVTITPPKSTQESGPSKRGESGGTNEDGENEDFREASG